MTNMEYDRTRRLILFLLDTVEVSHYRRNKGGYCPECDSLRVGLVTWMQKHGEPWPEEDIRLLTELATV